MSYGTVQAEKMTTESGYSLGAGNASSFKNRIINGAMVIDQRNNGSSVSVSNPGTYLVDRFKAENNTDGTLSAQQSSTVPTGFKNSLAFTVGTADASLGGGQYAITEQRIEGLNLWDLNWGTANAESVTLSFQVRSSVTGTFGGSIVNSDFNRTYPFTYTISAANTWETQSITIPGDTSGTWLTTNGIGLIIRWGFGVGSSYSTTAGAWAAGGYLSATGATNLMATAGATFYITGVQFEVGTVATSFDFRSIGTELALCQRYYQTYGVGNGVGANTQRLISAANNGGNAICTWSFIQTMRAAPTATLYGSGTTTGNVGVNYASSVQTLAANTAVTYSNTSINGWMFNLGSTITANIVNWVDMGTQASGGGFTFSAEL